MKKIITLLLATAGIQVTAQELYPFSEPASNMPSHSISLKSTSVLAKSVHTSDLSQRHTAEIMLGLDRNWMVHGSLMFSDMHEQKFIWEGAKTYIKYRFLSNDDVHKHFRMAAFAAASYSRNHLDHNELGLADQSGVEGGIIATQLWNKLAVSATGSLMEVINKKRDDETYKDHFAFQAFNYSLSAGYLILPFEYTSYDQTNLNFYLELLGSRNIDFPEKYYVDLAPSIQLIFKSTGKLNLGYRFELGSDIYRFSRRSFMISYEHIFLNALKRSKVKGER